MNADAYRCGVCADPSMVLLLDVSTGCRLCRLCAETLHAMTDHYRTETNDDRIKIAGAILGT